MAEMASFRYIDFYDVPRCIFVSYRNRAFLLHSAFDEQPDAYSDSYTVYDVPDSIQECFVENGSWTFLDNAQMDSIGQIQVDCVRFDPTKRVALDPSCLDRFLLP
jgi:hypothetical protein